MYRRRFAILSSLFFSHHPATSSPPRPVFDSRFFKPLTWWPTCLNIFAVSRLSLWFLLVSWTETEKRKKKTTYIYTVEVYIYTEVYQQSIALFRHIRRSMFDDLNVFHERRASTQANLDASPKWPSVDYDSATYVVIKLYEQPRVQLVGVEYIYMLWAGRSNKW